MTKQEAMQQACGMNTDTEHEKTIIKLKEFIATKLSVDDMGYLLISQDHQCASEAIQNIQRDWHEFYGEESMANEPDTELPF